MQISQVYDTDHTVKTKVNIDYSLQSAKLIIPLSGSFSYFI